MIAPACRACLHDQPGNAGMTYRAALPPRAPSARAACTNSNSRSLSLAPGEARVAHPPADHEGEDHVRARPSTATRAIEKKNSWEREDTSMTRPTSVSDHPAVAGDGADQQPGACRLKPPQDRQAAIYARPQQRSARMSRPSHRVRRMRELGACKRSDSSCATDRTHKPRTITAVDDADHEDQPRRNVIEGPCVI